MPFESAFLISSSSAREDPPPPQLFDKTRTLAPPEAVNAFFAWMANSMALTASEMLPLPPESRNLMPMTLAIQLTPTTPTPLLPAAPRVPDGWVHGVCAPI